MISVISKKLVLPFTNFFHGLSPLKHVCVACAAWALLFSLISDIFTLLFSPLSQISSASLGYFSFFLSTALIGIVLPCFIILSVYAQIRQHLWPIPFVVKNRYFRYFGIVVIVGLLILFFLTVETFFPISVVPFVTSICVVVWLVFGRLIAKQLDESQRVFILTLFLLFILSVKYLDCNPSKGFVRNLFQIQRGMAVEEVEGIMQKYQINQWESESKLGLSTKLGYNGSRVYQSAEGGSNSKDFGEIVFNDGRVVDVEIILPD